MRRFFATLKLYSEVGNRVNYCLLALMLLGLISSSAYAQVLTSNSFTGTVTCPSSSTGNVFSTVPNATVTPFTRSVMTCNAGNNVFNSTTLNPTASRVDNNYIEFSITSAIGYTVNLTALSFQRQGSGTAPNSLIVSSSTDNFTSRSDLGTSITPASTASLTLAAPVSTTSGGTVTFRFYTFGTTSVASGTAAAGGTFRVDDVTLYGSVVAAVDNPPTVTSTSPTSLATGVAPVANISLTFSEPVTASASSFSVVGSVSGPHTFALTGGPTSYTLNPDTDFANNETVTVTALSVQIKDQDGTLDNMASDYVYSFTIAPDLPPTVVSTSPASSVTNVTVNANISLTFSEPVTASASSFNLVGSVSGTHTFTLSGGPTSYSLDPDMDFMDGETVTVTAFATLIADQDGTPDNMASDYVYSFTIAPPVAVVKIHDIQGTGLRFNPAFGGTQRIEGIVTRAFSGTASLTGFYVQEEDADADANSLTSEGIFVFDPAGLFTGNEGDKVNITGTVVEYVTTSTIYSSTLTQLTSLVSVVNMGPSVMPIPAVVNLPVANVADLEAYESMLVTMGATTGNLAVTEYFLLGQYGQVTLAATGASDVIGTDARLDQYTQFYAPSVSGYATYLAELAKRKIILDDGRSVSNPDPIIFGRGGLPLSATNTLRGGDQIASITTVLDERFEGYRLQSKTGVNFMPTNVRPSSPPNVGAATLKVASANVLNFFIDLDPSGNGTVYRGARTAEEFTRQRTKIIKNLVGSGADAFGIMELQRNNPGSINAAIQNLVAGMNAETGSSGTYAFVDPAATGGSISTDAITVGIIYKTDKVTPVGNPASLTSSAAFDLVGRRPLAQTFSQNSNGEVFTLVVNHFKSKGSSAGGANDVDTKDGQGASNGTRTRQARDLATWLATNPTGTTDPDYLVVGDLNAYAKEDPLTTLAAAGFNNLLPATTYSYVFDGQVGALDHALGTVHLKTQVTGAEKWHINADEPGVLDYSTQFKSAGQVVSLYNPDQFRSSDHDPVLIGLNLVPSADLTPIVYIRPSTTHGEANISVVVDVTELNSAPTSGTITVYVTKDTKAPLSFTSTVTTLNGRSIQNSAWTFDGVSNSSFYVLTTTQTIAADDVLSFGLGGTLAPGATKGTINISSIITVDNGSEVRIINNSDTDRIDYFNQ